MVAKKAHIENFNGANKGTAESNLRDNQITSQDLCPSFSARTKEDFTGLSLPHMVAKKAHIEKIDSVNQGYAKSILPEKTNQELHPSNCARTKEGCTSLSSPHKHTVTKKAHDAPEPKIGQAENSNVDMQGALKRSELLHRITKHDKMKVFLYSLNPRSKNKCMAEGTLVSRDKTYVVGGNMLGEQYVAVSISAVTRHGNEALARPCETFETLRDAIGHVIAWPLSHVKKPKLTTRTHSPNKPPNTG
ncbi:uncharacterized protein LOC123440262 [Hordeum vulgare subsp. vulgare]|uniref:uncharacterized protein LOC123440262 n=1 Tax=Hordeum vulgare subsp. vulgare TaxID=112509 RepID=UPI001D1A472D|nr:uncharacterized protein LOC123440262 [Hordeum vulgare subsp. vulgare]